jgi:uncharacterized protein (DUF58 family)
LAEQVVATPHSSRSFDPRLLAALPGLQLKARYVMEGFLSGVHGSPFHGLSVEFSEYRDYQPGDDPRRIDWRFFARTDRLCVKRFEQETNARCYLACDTSASMAYRGTRAWGTKMDAARVLCAALGSLLLRQNDAVGCLGLADASLRFLPPSRIPGQLGRLLGRIQGFVPGGGAALESLLTQASRLLHRRSLVLVASDLLEPSEAVERAFERLRFDGHECLVLQVLDPDELDFPFAEGTILEDLETGSRRETRPGARERYRRRFGEAMEGWRSLFSRLEVPHTVVRTDEDPRRTLTRLLVERKRLR